MASLESPSTEIPMTPISKGPEQEPQEKNRVLRVLMRRLGSSKTFGENMIFMLNRAREYCFNREQIYTKLALRSHARRPMHAAASFEDFVSAFHHERHLRILLH